MSVLALAVLEAAAGLDAAVFLAFDHTRIAAQEQGGLQRLAQFRLEIGEGFRNPVLDGTRLPRQSTADHQTFDIELTGTVGNRERLVDDHLQNRASEIDGQFTAVDDDLAAAGLDPDAGNGVFALAGGIGTAAVVDLAFMLGRRRALATIATAAAPAGASTSCVTGLFAFLDGGLDAGKRCR